MTIFTVIAVVFGAVISWLITRSILAQLGCEPGLAVSIANRISEGDLSFTIDTKKDDKSSLLFAIKQMRDNLTHIVADVRNRLPQAIWICLRVLSSRRHHWKKPQRQWKN
jgi:methyl-accepting chemotaxis protein